MCVQGDTVMWWDQKELVNEQPVCFSSGHVHIVCVSYNVDGSRSYLQLPIALIVYYKVWGFFLTTERKLVLCECLDFFVLVMT